MKRFEVTEEHLKLMREMNIRWWDCEVGAPCIDPKRPYGNSDEISDIHFILTGGKLHEVDSKKEEEKLRERYRELHKETMNALQICLMFGTFTPGVYLTDGNWRDWHKLEVADAE